MNIIEGHLTATEKKHVKAIIEQGLSAGKVNRKTYILEALAAKEYRVYITENKTNWCESSPRKTTTVHHIKIN